MILFATLLTIILSIILIILAAVGLLGTGVIIIFGDVIAFVFIVIGLFKLIHWLRN